jgi:hypothetical protein
VPTAVKYSKNNIIARYTVVNTAEQKQEEKKDADTTTNTTHKTANAYTKH